MASPSDRRPNWNAIVNSDIEAVQETVHQAQQKKIALRQRKLTDSEAARKLADKLRIEEQSKAPVIKLTGNDLDLRDLIHAVSRGHNCTFDLCGKIIRSGAGRATAPDKGEIHLSPPGHCTIRNGVIELASESQIRVAAEQVRLDSVLIVKKHAVRPTYTPQPTAIEVIDGGSLSMHYCGVDGDHFGHELNSGLVRVTGGSKSSRAPSSLSASECKVSRAYGHGLVVRGGGQAALEKFKANQNERWGILVEDEDSQLHAVQCSLEGNVVGGIAVWDSAHASIAHCSSTGTILGPGIHLRQEASMTAIHSRSSNNSGAGAILSDGGSLILDEGCACNDNGGYGLCVLDIGSSIVTKSKCVAKGNKVGNAVQFYPACIICASGCDLGGQAVIKK